MKSSAPAARSVSRLLRDQDRPPMPPDQPVSILLVDDRRENLVALEALLQGVAEDVVSASSGEEALRCVLERQFAVILLDVDMPGLDGFETADLIRSREQSHHTPIIFVTASDGGALAQFKGYAAGAVDYLFKPLIPEVLQAKVSVFVELARKTQALQQAQAALQQRVEGQSLELRESEERFRLFVESTKDYALFLLDPEGRIASWNRGAALMYQYSAHEAIGQPLAMVYPAEEQAAVRAARELETALREGCFEEEGWRVRKDGSRFWASVVISPLVAENGTLRGFGKVVRDLTDRRATEEALQAREAFLEAVLENLTESVVACDRNGILSLFNRASRELHGLPEEAIGAEHWAEHYSLYRSNGATPLTREELPLYQALRGGPVRDEEMIIAVPGREPRRVRASGQQIRNAAGETLGAVVAVRDVTAQREAEEALVQSQTLFRDFMQHSPALAFVRDSEGRLVYVNTAYERFFGASFRDLKGTVLSEVVPEATASALRILYQRVLTEDRAIQEDHPIPSPEGQAHHLRFYVFPIAKATGERLLGGFVLDISDQRLLEAQLRQSQKMDAIGRLAGGIAHDFNNMLAVINGYSEMLLGEPDLSPRLRSRLGEVLQAGGRAAALTRQLLIFSRNQILELRHFDLNELVANLEKMLARVIGEDIVLTTSFRVERCPVLLDPAQIEQVLLNLVINARDAMPRGGRITLSTDTVELTPAYPAHHFAVPPGPYAVLSVSDRGCGMSADVLAQIFDPFFTTKEVGKGTGLGLATVYGIVRQSAGDIQVESTPQCGTTFRILLPLAPDAFRPVARDAASDKLTRGTETILLVEDETMVRELAKEVLTRAGYTVLAERDVRNAMLRCATYPHAIHLLLTDLVMPLMSGRELADSLQEDRPRMRVLYMSGYTDDAVLRYGLCAGERSFLQKPFRPAELTAAVRRVLDAD